MTNTALSIQLAAIGHTISPAVIRQDWGKGAPRNTAAAYLAWRGKRAEKTSRGDPMLRVLRAEKLRHEIAVLKERALSTQRENYTASRELISRAWMAERVHLAAGKVDAFRQTSESEHPLLFAAAEGDVPKCREVVRKIWDEIMVSMQSLAADFDEPATIQKGELK